MDAASLLDNPIGSIIGFALGIPANTALIYVLANYVVDLGDKSTIKNSFICALGLAVVQSVAIGVSTVSIPLLNLILALVVWYKGSVAVIEGSLEATKGGFTILVICTGISIAATIASMAATAS